MTGKGEPLTNEEMRILEPKDVDNIFQSSVNISTQIVDIFLMYFASYLCFVLKRRRFRCLLIH